MAKRIPSEKILAQQLIQAEEGRCPIPPLSETYANLTLDDAYRVQLQVVSIRESRGEKVVGKKIGLTSKAVQQALGVGEPDYGHIMDAHILHDGEPLARDRLIQPRIEAELAFILKRRIQGPGVTAAHVQSATEGVMAALEVIDSRIENWKIKIVDTVADNASIGMVILGPRLYPAEALDFRHLGMVFEKNGEVLSTAAGAAVLGNPLHAVAWLANKLAHYDIALEEGDIIMSGAFAAPFPIETGESARATFQGLGSVGIYCV